MSDQAIIPETKFFDFSTALLPEVLALQAPPFSNAKESFRQLRYVARYAEELGCQSMAVENHYIDRDYIEDHSVFYSKSLHPYPNYCRRVHFFSKSKNEVQDRFRAVVAEGIKGGETAYRKLGSEFSDEAYLGFCVVRPLDGSPVGRTVMKTYPEVPSDPAKSVYQNEIRSREIENKSRCSRASGMLGECRHGVRSGRGGDGIDATNCWSVRPPSDELPSRCHERCGVWPAPVGCRVDAALDGVVASRRLDPLEPVEGVGADARAVRTRWGPHPPTAAVV